MQLSQQDYYLAVNGGLCKAEAEWRWYDQINTDYDIYLTLNLPDFNRDKAWFEGKVTIKSELGEVITLNIVRGTERILVTPDKNSVLFKPATEKVLDKKKESYDMDKEKIKKLSADEKLWTKLMTIATGQPLPQVTQPSQENKRLSDNLIGLFLIKQRLGQIRGDHQLSVYVNYWSNGRLDKEGKEITPYLLSYRYHRESVVVS
jgi:hypothetical protein